MIFEACESYTIPHSLAYDALLVSEYQHRSFQWRYTTSFFNLYLTKGPLIASVSEVALLFQRLQHRRLFRRLVSLPFRQASSVYLLPWTWTTSLPSFASHWRVDKELHIPEFHSKDKDFRRNEQVHQDSHCWMQPLTYYVTLVKRVTMIP